MIDAGPGPRVAAVEAAQQRLRDASRIDRRTSPRLDLLLEFVHAHLGALGWSPVRVALASVGIGAAPEPGSRAAVSAGPSRLRQAGWAAPGPRDSRANTTIRCAALNSGWQAESTRRS